MKINCIVTPTVKRFISPAPSIEYFFIKPSAFDCARFVPSGPSFVLCPFLSYDKKISLLLIQNILIHSYLYDSVWRSDV